MNKGKRIVYQSVEEHIPSAGLQLLYEDGDVCEVTGKRRRTIVNLPCDPNGDGDIPPVPARGYEGNKQTICNYHVEFVPNKSFCPTLRRGLVEDYNPVITAGKVFEFAYQSYINSLCISTDFTEASVLV